MAKNHHQKSHFAKVMSLQGIFSVAAVMVFSMYIFFEVDKDHAENMHQDLFHSPQPMLRSSPKSPSPSSVQTEQEIYLEQRTLKQAKKSVEKASAESLAIDVRELSAREASSPLVDAQETAQYELADQNVSAEDRLKDIEVLLDAGKIEAATIEYKRFKAFFPEYKVPKHILDAINNQLE